MNQFNLYPDLISEAIRYQQGIIKQIRQYELVSETRKLSHQNVRMGSKVLASFGKQLIVIGSRLEARFGNNRKSALRFLDQYSVEEDCLMW